MPPPSNPGLSAHEAPDPATLWAHMRRLLDRVSLAFESEHALDDCLDTLIELLGADRGLVLALDADGASRIINARGAGGALSVEDREEVSRGIIRDALATGECIVWQAAATTDALSQSMMGLNILAALAAPLHGFGGQRPFGVLYVDVRDWRKHVSQEQVEFFMAAIVLFSAVLELNRRGQTTREQLREARAHATEARATPPLDELLAWPTLRAVRTELLSAIDSDSSVLILGESGTGKTLLAQSMAEASGRRPIVRAVLGGSDDLNTITSELFGHERGAFSGATGKRLGLVEFANGGTLIFDELLNLPPHAQKLLLDFTQFGQFRPLGYAKAEPKRAEVRILAATNGDLDQAMRDGRLRPDLYHRLAAVRVVLPPLRERRADIPALAEGVLARADRARTWTLSLELRRLLVSDALAWPGNIRELERVVRRARERAVTRDPATTVLEPEHLEPSALERVAASPTIPPMRPPEDEPTSLAETWQRLQEERTATDARERELLRVALKQAGGVVAHAAKELGIARTTLASKLDALGIPRR